MPTLPTSPYYARSVPVLAAADPETKQAIAVGQPVVTVSRWNGKPDGPVRVCGWHMSQCVYEGDVLTVPPDRTPSMRRLARHVAQARRAVALAVRRSRQAKVA